MRRLPFAYNHDDDAHADADGYENGKDDNGGSGDNGADGGVCRQRHHRVCERHRLGYGCPTAPGEQNLRGCCCWR